MRCSVSDSNRNLHPTICESTMRLNRITATTWHVATFCPWGPPVLLFGSYLMCFLLAPGEGALCSIPIENILAVERLEEESFKMKNVRTPHVNHYEAFQALWSKMTPAGTSFRFFSHLFVLVFCQMFQVIQPERVLYIQANNCVEARDWIDILTKVSQCNRKRLSTYHPSAYLNGHWLCCKLSADTEPGCTPCTGSVTLPIRIQHLTPSCLGPLSHSLCISISAAASQQISSWTWMETERRRGFIPSSAHTWPNWPRCKVKHRHGGPPAFVCCLSRVSPRPSFCPRRGLWQ